MYDVYGECSSVASWGKGGGRPPNGKKVDLFEKPKSAIKPAPKEG